MATAYEVSDDGLTYTVHLMEGVPWVRYNADTGQVEAVKDCSGKDRTVTAQDFAYGILRTIDPATASDYAYALLPYLAGAADLQRWQQYRPRRGGESRLWMIKPSNTPSRLRQSIT